MYVESWQQCFVLCRVSRVREYLALVAGILPAVEAVVLEVKVVVTVGLVAALMAGFVAALMAGLLAVEQWCPKLT